MRALDDAWRVWCLTIFQHVGSDEYPDCNSYRNILMIALYTFVAVGRYNMVFVKFLSSWKGAEHLKKYNNKQLNRQHYTLA